MSEQTANGNYAEIPGVRFWYTDSGGRGEAIVLLHATTATCVSWEPQIKAFANAGYRVIAPDRRGWGRSTVNAATGDAVGTGADDLDAFADQIKLERFHLMGIGGGGLIALDYAAWRRERLLSMVIGSCIASKT